MDAHSISCQEHRSLQPFNTFGIAAQARYLTEARSVCDLENILFSERFRHVPKLFLGGGSNVLFTKDFDGLVVLVKIGGIETVREDESHVWLKAGAGVNWHAFVMHTIGNDMGGVENLSLIPGTVGAAPMQNVGAYGVETKDTFDSLEALGIESGELRVFSHAECRFGYRESVFKHELRGKYIITSVTFRLKKKPSVFNVSYGDIQKTLSEMNVAQPTLRTVSEAVIRIRQSKLPDPAQIGNAGSFFKNPVIARQQFEELKVRFPDLPAYPAETDTVKIPAGWLIEQCGWKGMRVGNTGVHQKQALVLVNYGGADGLEIKNLSEKIQASVLEKYNIRLQAEVNFV